MATLKPAAARIANALYRIDTMLEAIQQQLDHDPKALTFLMGEAQDLRRVRNLLLETEEEA